MDPDPQWYLDNVLAYAEPGRIDRVRTGRAAAWHAWWREQWVAAERDEASRIARDQGFVVSAAQLRVLGWVDHELRREVRRGRWSVPVRGVASPVVVPEGADAFLTLRRRHALAAAAVALRRRGQVISGRSAAILHGLPTLTVPPTVELTAAPPTILGLRGGAHLYSATLGISDVTTWFGAPTTTVARTVVDSARHGRQDGLIAADAALRECLVQDDEIRAAGADATGWPGVRRAREVLKLADPRAESAFESVVRLALHDAGFPAPDLQVEFYDPRRRCTYRVDFLLRELRLIIEADGRDKYVDDELWREKRREGRLRALTGNRVERVVWADVQAANWPETEERLRTG